MSDIAAATSSSLSRLSHVVKRLEAQGLLRRERVPGAGQRTNDAAAADDLAALRRVSETVIERIDPGRPC